jgi:hypothetical protein
MAANRNEKTMAVYTVRKIEKEGGKDFWTRIGTCFPHSKGDGFTIVLDAAPLGDRLVVRPLKAKSPEAPGAEVAA